MIDASFTQRYHETWRTAFNKGSSLPEELDRNHMLHTRQRKRALLEDAAFDLSKASMPLLAAQNKVTLEAATFADGVRAAIAWLERRAKETQ
jgi:hypothetical protein